METVQIDNSVISDILSGASPAFRIWVLDALHGRYELFKRVVEAMKISGIADGEVGTLKYLRGLAEKQGHNPKNGFAVADITGDTALAYSAELKRRIMKNAVLPMNPYRFFGTLAHQAIPELFASDFYRKSARLPRENADKQITFQWGPSPQLGLFETASNGKTHAELLENGVSPRWHSAKTVFAAMEWELQEAQIVLESEDGQFYRMSIVKLERALRPVFGRYVEKLVHYAPAHRLATLLALASWASAALHYWTKTGKRVLFREVKVMAPGRDLSGGRIDAIELRRPDGKALSRAQKKMLARLLEYPVISAGHLLWELRSLKSLDLEVAVNDWKFTVGDGTNGGIIAPADIAFGPLSEHVSQVQRYVSLAVVDMLHFNKAQLESFSWREFLTRSPVEGWLEYFMPKGVVVHSVPSTSPDLQEKLIEIACGLDEAPARAAVRGFWNLFLREALKCLDGNESNGAKRGFSAPSASRLFKDDREAVSFIRRYRPAREFADVHYIVEVVGSDSKGNPVLRMNYRRLLEAVNKGELFAAPGFRLGYDGKISCMLHKDPGPSLHLYIQQLQPSFHCFGCKAHGEIDIASIPLDMDIILRTGPGRSAHWEPGMVPVIPEKHHKLMELAQKLLQQNFHGSLGETYLRMERKLDPDLCYQMGAGFATWSLINGLMDAGYALDDLIEAGLVRISDYITPETGIGPLLKERGCKPDEMKREWGKSEKSGVIWGYPRSFLDRRVTFPLKYRGLHTNFYARAINDRVQTKHIKTSSGIIQGGFNMEVLEKPEYEEVIPVEAAICAVTLVQMGHKPALALIGTDNYAILDSIVQSGKSIALGLDLDPPDLDPEKGETGQKQTKKITEFLKRIQFDRYRDFTAWFVGQNKVQNFKDFNDYWRKCCP
ncbi:MAG: hypothetical protein Q8R12_04860 [bacterium]|nr:hypothetical protein [bacterium]